MKILVNGLCSSRYNDHLSWVDFLCNWLVWSPCWTRDSQVFSSITVQKNLYFSNQPSFFFFCLTFYFYFILLYNTVLVLPYIDMNPPQVYMRSQTWTPFPPPSPQHPSGSSPCTSPKHAVSCIGHRLVIRFLHDSIHVSMPFSQIIPPSPSPSESKSPLYISVTPTLKTVTDESNMKSPLI